VISKIVYTEYHTFIDCIKFMKNKHRKFLGLFKTIIFLFLIGITWDSFSQKILNYGIQVNPGICWINGGTPKELIGFEKKGGYIMNFGLSGKYYFNKKVGIYTGLQYFDVLYNVQGNNFNITYTTKDSENKLYERIITGTDIYEKSSIQTFQIPVCLFYEKTLSRTFRIFAMLGPSIAIPFRNKMEARGTFSYKGYYQEGNFTLENLPLYGFNSDVPVNLRTKLKTNFISLGGMIVTGCSFTLNRHWKFETSFIYLHSLTPFVKTQKSFSFSRDLGSFHSILENKTTKLNNLSLGITFYKVLLF
jgi:hypothetical protein